MTESQQNYIVGCADLPLKNSLYLSTCAGQTQVKIKERIGKSALFGVSCSVVLHLVTSCLSIDKAHSDVHDLSVSRYDLRIVDSGCFVYTAHQNFHNLLLQVICTFTCYFRSGFLFPLACKHIICYTVYRNRDICEKNSKTFFANVSKNSDNRRKRSEYGTRSKENSHNADISNS